MTEPEEIDKTELYLARRRLQLARREAELRRDNAIAFFQPHPKQITFFEAAAKYRYRYARTGNRFGKSEMGSAEDISFALGYRPWFPEGDPRRTAGIPPHETKGLIVCTTWKKSQEVFTEMQGGNRGKLFKYIPASALGTPSRNHSGFIDRIPVRHISGRWSIIHIDTIEGYKKNPLAQESSVWDWVHIDEPIPEKMWKAIARGLVDRGGSAWFTCTPLTEPWIDEAFVPDLGSDRGESVSFTNGDRFMMTGSMYDNPHNTESDIQSFLSWLTPEEQECRINGLPTSFSGLVYKEFSWTDHVLKTLPPGWSTWSTPPPDYCVRFAIDYHFRKNDAVLFIATSPQNIHYVYAELWRQMLLEEEVSAIKDILGKHVPQPGLVDPLASTPGKVTEITAMDEYRRLGLPVLPATKDPVNGIRAVKSQLKARDKHGRPVIFFNPACSRTLFEISRGFVWDDDENRPIKKNDDMMENLYRLCLDGLPYVEPATAEDYKPIQPTDFSTNVVEFPDLLSSGFDDDKKDRARKYANRYRA